MADKNKSVYDRLDEIEIKLDEVSNKLENKNLNQQLINTQANQIYNQYTQVKNQTFFEQVIHNAKKVYINFGTLEDFKKDKMIVKIISILLIVFAFLFTVFTSIALKLYSTFTLLENIWMIFASIMLYYSCYAKRRMVDIDLKNHSTDVFITATNNLILSTHKEKARFKWFRRISYIASCFNILLLVVVYSNAISIIAIICEICFIGFSIGLFFAYSNQFSTYMFILLINKDKMYVYEPITHKLFNYDEFCERFKGYV